MSTHALRSLSLLAAAGLAGAAEPLVDVAVAPSAGIVQRFLATPYGKVWADPALQPLRDAIDEARRQAVDKDGFDVAGTLLGLRGAGFRLLGITADQASYAMILDLGENAAAITATMAKAGAIEVTGADDAWTTVSQRFARFGTVLRVTSAGADGFPEWKPQSGEDDLVARADLRALCVQGMAAKPDPQQDPAIDALIAKLGEVRLAMRLGAEDLETRIHARWPTAGLLPVARARLERVPANALEMTAVGFDGAAWWKEFGPPILGIAVATSRDAQGDLRIATPADAQAVADEALAKLDLPALPALLSSLSGTMVMFSTPGTPFPGYTFSLARSPGLDAVAKALLAKAGLAAPAEGVATALPIPNLPIMPQVLVTKDEWVLTTDPLIASSWPASGWADSVAGKAVLGKFDERTVLIGASDTAAQLRMITGMAGMFLGNIPATPTQKQAVMAGLTKLAAVAKPAWSVARIGADGIDVEGRGLGSSSAVAAIAIVAAIAVPNLLESRVQAQESAAASALKSGVLPAEVQFQSGGYVDQDGNGVGEYGFPSEMSGLVAFDAGKLNLLAPSYQHLEKPISGYRYAVFLPNGTGDGALSDPYPGKRPAGPVGDRERCWVAYAWPADPKQGRRMFGINQAGNVYTELYQGEAPAWNALMGGKGWRDQPTWKPYRRR